jgi:probable phosphoglycerate mutase
MEILLIRHGEPEWVRDGFNVDDPVLTSRGHEQARATAKIVAAWEPDEIYVSPLVRARQTAAPLYETCGREETIAPWLEEIRNPVWHATPAEKVEESFNEHRRRPVHRLWDGLDGGESVRSFQERIRLGASLFLDEHGVHAVEGDLPVFHIDEPGRRVVLVAHAGTNSVTLCHLLGVPGIPWEWDRFVFHHASVTRLEAIEIAGMYTFSLTRLSDVEHLAESHRTR